MMMPDAMLYRNNACVFLRSTLCKGLSQWTTSDEEMIGIQSGAMSTRIVCMPGLYKTDEDSTYNLWPNQNNTDLKINGLAVTLPKTGMDLAPFHNKSAPILDISTIIHKENVLDILVKDGIPNTNRYFAVVVTVAKIVSLPHRFQSMAYVRVLNPSFCFLANEVSCELAKRPAGSYLGARNCSLVDVKRIWTREMNSTMRLYPQTFPDGMDATAILKLTDKIPGLEATDTTLAAHGLTTDVDVESERIGFSLRDPITRALIKVPIRADVCKHVSCFDMETYFALNTKPGARYKCPCCNVLAMPSQLFIDSYQLGILRMLHDGKRKGTRKEVVEAAVRKSQPKNLLGIAEENHVVPDVILDRNIIIDAKGAWTISGEDVPEPRPKRIRKAVDRLVL